MLLLVSDTNILFDVEVSDLVVPMFSLDYQFAVPDVLFYEELQDRHAHLLDLGMQVRTLSAERVERVQELARYHARPGRNDLFALALAEAEACPLLTGDAALRQAAQAERVEVRGTVWLLGEMVRKRSITVSAAHVALDKMRRNGRRLPWDLAEQTLEALGGAASPYVTAGHQPDQPDQHDQHDQYDQPNHQERAPAPIEEPC
ncbi:DUF3368 domain-containing protein [Paraburkholderia sp. 2C]